MRPDTIVPGSFGEGMPPLRLDGLRRHPDVTTGENFGQLRKNRHDDEGFEEMIQLLRRTPPPENFMSIPDSFSPPEDEKRRKFRLFRKVRKPKKSSPPTIKLPDSAVAARTTGGHRYIAISIPVEHSYQVSDSSLNNKPNSKEKTPANREALPKFGRKASLDRPITFLKPVAEDRESPSSLSPGTSPCIERTASNTGPTESQSTYMAQPPGPQSLQNKQSHQVIGGHPNDSSQGRYGNESRIIDPTQPEEERIATVKRSEPDASDVKNVVQTVEEPQGERTERRSKSMDLPRRMTEQTEYEGSPKGESSRGSGASTPMIISSTNPAIKLILPSRSSSKKAKTSTRGEQRGETPINNNRRMSASGIMNLSEINDNFLPRGSFAESLLTTESSPKLLKAETARMYHTIPIVVASAPRYHIASPLDFNFPSPPSSRRVSRSVQTDLPEISLQPSSPPPPKETKSDEDHIDESNSEDMDEYRTPITDEREAKDITENDIRSPPLLHDRLRPNSKRPGIAPNNAMPGMKPTMPDTTPTAVLGKQKEKHTDTPLASIGRLLPPRNCSFLPHSCIPARSSSYRKAEKREFERGHERKPTPKARHIAKTLAERREACENLSHQQLLNRYESLKETYIYDMEKRQRRLERHVEYLVRSVGPFLENINRRLEEQHALQREGHFACPPGAASSSTRPRPRPRPRQKDQPPPPADASSSNIRSVPDLINLFDANRSQSFHGREPRRTRHRPTSLQLGDHHHHHQQRAPQARGNSTRQADQPIIAGDAHEQENPLREEIEQRWFDRRPRAGQEEPSTWRPFRPRHSDHEEGEEEEEEDEGEISGAGPARPGIISPMIQDLPRRRGKSGSESESEREYRHGDTDEGDTDGDEEEESGEREEFDNICKAFARF
ncbi:hypothetical protein F4775DRAFT_602812 [Biscogniauxia sp. FL1348]|nr:hypothetical protein F4775DRAFT_602812 [Biscogniauxia sp. FL1348]